jgi:hypothetical protein
MLKKQYRCITTLREQCIIKKMYKPTNPLEYWDAKVGGKFKVSRLKFKVGKGIEIPANENVF